MTFENHEVECARLSLARCVSTVSIVRDYCCTRTAQFAPFFALHVRTTS